MSTTREKAIASMNSHHKIYIDDEKNIDLDMTFQQNSYDSLDLVELVMSIEKDLGISIPDEDINIMVTPKSMLDKFWPEETPQ